MFELGRKVVTPEARNLLANANVSPESIFTEHTRRAVDYFSGDDQSPFITYQTLEDKAVIVITAHALEREEWPLYTWVIAVTEAQLKELRKEKTEGEPVTAGGEVLE